MKTHFVMCVAMDNNGLIGNSNSKYGIPWEVPEDLQRFRRTVEGKPCVVGRKTAEMIPKWLKKSAVVLSRSSGSIEDQTRGLGPVIYVCGGREVYAAMAAMCDLALVTRINSSYEGDCYFPDIDLGNLVYTEQNVSSKSGVEILYQTWLMK